MGFIYQASQVYNMGEPHKVPKSHGEKRVLQVLCNPPSYLKLDQSLIPGLVYPSSTDAEACSELGGGFPSRSLLGMGCFTG